MPAQQIEKRPPYREKPFRVSRAVPRWSSPKQPYHRCVLQSMAADDAEMRFMTRAVTGMVIAAAIPLVLLLVVTFFYPEALWIPVTPD